MNRENGKINVSKSNQTSKKYLQKKNKSSQREIWEEEVFELDSGGQVGFLEELFFYEVMHFTIL